MKTDTALVNHAQNFLMADGSPAKKLLKNNMNTGALRTNDVLRHEDWLEIDKTLIGVSRQRLIGIGDLTSRGLRLNLGGLGVLLSGYEQLGDMTAADVDYAAVTDGEEDSVTFTLVNVPVPIIHKDFSINIRRQAASLNGNGPAIDTVQVETAAMKVTEKMEDILFNGFTGGALDGNTLYGYTTHPAINTQSGGDWGTITNPQADLINAMDKLEGDLYWAPWILYVATTQFGQLRAFFTDGSGDQVFDRLKRLNGLEDIRPADRITAGTALLIAMRRDVVDIAVGQDLTVVEWDTKGGLMAHFKVMTAIAPRIKSDAAGNSGICLLSGI